MVPGDQRDYDQGNAMYQLFTTNINGIRTQVVGAGSKIGYYFVVFANNGSLIYKTKFGLHLNDNSTEGMFPPNEIIPGWLMEAWIVFQPTIQ